MIVYVIVNENKSGEQNVLGAFTEEEKARIKAEEYQLDYEEEECWIERIDTEEWPYEQETEYKIVHRTMVSKTTGMKSHVIVFLKEEVPLLTDGQEWYTIQQENASFDEAEGLERNMKLLQVYLQGKAAGEHSAKTEEETS